MSELIAVRNYCGNKETKYPRNSYKVETYLVIQKHKNKKDQCLIHHVVEDEHGCVDNARIKIE